MSNYIYKTYNYSDVITDNEIIIYISKTIILIYSINKLLKNEKKNEEEKKNVINKMKKINNNLYKIFQYIGNQMDNKKINININITLTDLTDFKKKFEEDDNMEIFLYNKHNIYIAPLLWLELFDKFPDYIYNDSNFINEYIQTIWIILKWTGLKVMNIYDYVKIMVVIINNKTRENYIIIDCVRSEEDTKLGIIQNYTCGRAITTNTNNIPVTRNDLPVIVIYNTVSSMDDSMDYDQNKNILKKYKNKYLKYKQKYIQLKKLIKLHI